jgi:four helix bundle protein
MGKITNVEDMPVYQILYKLSLDIEKASRGYGCDFRWLRTQTLRSSESVAANMTEGFYAQYSTEYLQALYRARREGRETCTHMKYAKGVGQLSSDTALHLLQGYEDGMHQLSGLICSIEKKIKERGKAKPGAHRVRETPADYSTRELMP